MSAMDDTAWQMVAKAADNARRLPLTSETDARMVRLAAAARRAAGSDPRMLPPTVLRLVGPTTRPDNITETDTEGA